MSSFFVVKMRRMFAGMSPNLQSNSGAVCGHNVFRYLFGHNVNQPKNSRTFDPRCDMHSKLETPLHFAAHHEWSAVLTACSRLWVKNFLLLPAKEMKSGPRLWKKSALWKCVKQKRKQCVNYRTCTWSYLNAFGINNAFRTDARRRNIGGTLYAHVAQRTRKGLWPTLEYRIRNRMVELSCMFQIFFCMQSS